MAKWNEGKDLNTFEGYSPFTNMNCIRNQIKQRFFEQLYNKKMYISKEPYDYHADPDGLYYENGLRKYNKEINELIMVSFDEKYIKWIDEDIKNTLDKYF